MDEINNERVLPEKRKGHRDPVRQVRGGKPADTSGIQVFPHAHPHQHRSEPGNERRVVNGDKRCGIDPERQKPDGSLQCPDKKTSRNAEQPGQNRVFLKPEKERGDYSG